jgi:hypothetical protein
LETFGAASDANKFDRILLDQFPSPRALKNCVHQAPDVALRFRRQGKAFKPILNGQGFHRREWRLGPTGRICILMLDLYDELVEYRSGISSFS